METRNPEPESLAESLAGDDGVCPIPLTHDRLEEVHYWWHEMARNYHEPNQFRYSLGALVQAGRSVSFMLQKEKHVFADFRWYQSWFEYSKKSPFCLGCRVHVPTLCIVKRLYLAAHLSFGVSEILAIRTATMRMTLSAAL